MLIDAERANYPIRWMCKVLEVPRSSFYDWRTRSKTVTATARHRATLGHLVKVVFDEFRQTYGCRRIARELNDRGHACSVGLVADLMREQGLIAVQPRRYRVTTIQARPMCIHRICSAGTSPPKHQAPGWWATSPTCVPVRGGPISRS